MIGAKEIVMPDTLFDSLATVQGAEESFLTIESLKNHVFLVKYRPRLMVVPQGQTRRELYDCGELLYKLITDHEKRLREVGVSGITIGISKDYEKFDEGLPRIVDDFMRYIIRPRLQIHLLGWGRSLWELNQIAQTWRQRIRSVDSAKPAVFGLSEIRLRYPEEPEYPGRSEKFFETELPEEVLEIVKRNIWAFDKAARGGFNGTPEM